MSVDLYYDPMSPNAVPDGEVEDYMRTICIMSKPGFTRSNVLVYSTSNIFHAVLTAIAQGRCYHEGVYFHFQGKTFKANEYGAIPNWPDGFCDMETRLAITRLRTAVEKKKSLRKEK